MFTGLVQDVGLVERLHSGDMTELWIRTSLGADSFALGESIAVDGACLTVVERQGEQFRVQASAETLRRTTLGELRVGSRVNLERALRLADRLGGHLVLGHVDAVGRIVGKAPEGGAVIVRFSLPAQLLPYFIEKGSVTVDGVSLTVNEVFDDAFTVALIPETQTRTTLGAKAVGASVNLEADVIGKYVARLYGFRGTAQTSGVTEELVKAAGFGSGPPKGT
jgi:riboflavin synthase